MDIWPFRKKETRNLAQQVVASMYYDTPSSTLERWLKGLEDPLTLVKSNPVAQKCVDKISRAVADYPLEVYINGEVQPDHPLVKVLNGSATIGQTAYQTKYAIGYMVNVYGEAYLNGIFTSLGLYSVQQVISPDKIKPVYDKTGLFIGFKIGNKIEPIDEKSGQSRYWRIGMVDPIDPMLAISPSAIGAKPIEENNTNRDYMKGMFRRFGRRPAVMILPKEAQGVTPEALQAAKEGVKKHFEGDPEGYVPLYVSGGASYQELGASASDMQSLDHRAATGREICFCYGVPPVLLGIAGDSTYSNQREANASFARDTVRPLINMVSSELTNWLKPYYTKDGEIEIRPDLSGDAFAMYERETNWDRITRANMLSTDEKRALTGYGPIDEIEGDSSGSVVLVSTGQAPLDTVIADMAVPDDNL